MRSFTTRLLPRVTTWKGYRRVFSRRRTWLPAMRMILARHGFAGARLSATFPGTCVVFFARHPVRGDVLVKLFPPMCESDFLVEAPALKLAAERARIPVPRVVARGVVNDRVDWAYLILKPVSGTALRQLLDRLPDAGEVARALGRTVRRLHAVRGANRQLPGRKGGPWPKLRKRLVRNALRRLRSSGRFSPALLSGLGRRLASLTATERGGCLVHGDITEDHVMLVRRRGRWRIAGIIDFADAVVADPMYELMPVRLGALARRKDLFRKYWRAYAPGTEIDRKWRDRAAAFAVIHAFGPQSLLHFLKRDRVATRRLTWDGLRDWLYPRSLEGRVR